MRKGLSFLRRPGFILASSVCGFGVACVGAASESTRAPSEEPRAASPFPPVTLSRDFRSDAGVVPVMQGDAGAIPDAGVVPDAVAIHDAGATDDAGNIGHAAMTVAGMRHGFRACYMAALTNYGAFSATVRLSLRVGADGAVVRVTGLGTNAPGELIECLFDEVGRHRFEPPEGGAAVVNVPVNLVAQGAHAPR